MKNNLDPFLTVQKLKFEHNVTRVTVIPERILGCYMTKCSIILCSARNWNN
jgi:hypothetical protein